MNVFFSWSGDRSKEVADALAPWLRQVIQAVEPWISTEIKKGTRWGPEISAQLELTRVGIICLTRDNLTEPWILFEAGALSKTKDAHVATFLLDVATTDVQQPLAQFNHTTAREEDVRRLVHTLNELVRSNGERALAVSDVDEVFDLFWPKLKAKLDAIKPLPQSQTKAPIRSDSDILREILEAVRSGSAFATGPAIGLATSIGPSVDEVKRRYRIRAGNGVSVDQLVDALGPVIRHHGPTWLEAVEDGPDGTSLVLTTSAPAHKAIQAALDSKKIRAVVKKIGVG